MRNDKKKMFILAAVVLLALIGFGQPEVEWSRCYGGYNNDFPTGITKVYDGGYIICGGSKSDDGDLTENYEEESGWIFKIDSLGTIEWQRICGGNSWDYINSICPTEDSCFILSGKTSSTDGDVVENWGRNNAWLLKIDQFGDIIWQSIQGNEGDDCINRSVVKDNGNIINIGYTGSSRDEFSEFRGRYDIWLFETDSLGELLWMKLFGTDIVDIGYDLAITDDGGYMLIGAANAGWYLTSADFHVVKTDSLGNLEWEQSYGGSDKDIGYRIIETIDNSFLLYGFTQSNDGDVTSHIKNQDVWIIKIDSLGNKIWDRCYGGSNRDIASDFSAFGDSFYIFTASSNSNNRDVYTEIGDYDSWLVIIDFYGNPIFQKAIGSHGYDESGPVLVDSSGFWILSDVSEESAFVTGHHGNRDIWLAHMPSFDMDTMAVVNANSDWNNSFTIDGIRYTPDIRPIGSEVLLSTQDSLLYPWDLWLFSNWNDSYTNIEHRITLIYDTLLTTRYILDTLQELHLVWENSYGGSYEELCKSIIQTSDGGYLIGGCASSDSGDVDGWHYGGHEFEYEPGWMIFEAFPDAWLLKLDSLGNIEWNTCYGRNGSDSGFAVIETDDNDYVFIGSSGNRAFINKYDSAGELIWNNLYYRELTYTFFDAADYTFDKSIITAGYIHFRTDDVRLNDILIVKFNDDGNIIWEKDYEMPGYQMAKSIKQTFDGGYILTGYSDIFEDKDIFVMKINEYGHQIWYRTYGGSSNEEGNSIIQTMDGNFVIAGYSESDDGDLYENNGGSDLWLFKINEFGDILWNKIYGEYWNDLANDVKELKSGDLLLSGGGNYGDVGLYNLSSDGYIFFKLNNAGEILRIENIGNDDCIAFGSIYNEKGNYVMAGEGIKMAGYHVAEYYPYSDDIYEDVWVFEFSLEEPPIIDTMHSITVLSEPASAGWFYIDEERCFKRFFPTGTEIMFGADSSHLHNFDIYLFSHWEDGDSSFSKTITIESDTVIYAHYEPYIEPYDLSLNCRDTLLANGTYNFKWQIEGESSVNPCSLYFYIDEPETLYLTADSHFTWIAPHHEQRCTLRLVVQDTSGYWLNEICIFDVIRESDSTIILNCPESLLTREIHTFEWDLDENELAGPCSLYFSGLVADTAYLDAADEYTLTAPYEAGFVELRLVALDTIGYWRNYFCEFYVAEGNSDTSLTINCPEELFTNQSYTFKWKFNEIAYATDCSLFIDYGLIDTIIIFNDSIYEWKAPHFPMDVCSLRAVILDSSGIGIQYFCEFAIQSDSAKIAHLHWAKNYGDNGRDIGYKIIENSDHTISVAGLGAMSCPGYEDHEVWFVNCFDSGKFIKIDSTGEEFFSQSINNGCGQGINSFRKTSDNGTILVGYAMMDSHHPSVCINANCWIVRLDSLNETVWDAKLGGSEDEKLVNFVELPDGSFIAVGWTESNDGDISMPLGNVDIWLIRIDNEGELIWEKSIGGYMNDKPNSLQLTNDGNLIMAASSNSIDGDLSDNNGNLDCWIVKLDYDGNIIWQKNYGGSHIDVAYDVKPTGDDGYIVAGATRSIDYDLSYRTDERFYDAWIIKLDASGNIIWDRIIKGEQNEIAYSIIETNEHNFILTGYTNSDEFSFYPYNKGSADVMIAKLNSTGDVIYKSCYGGSSNDAGYDIIQNSSGGYYITGYSMSGDGDLSNYNSGPAPDGHQYEDLLLIKLAADEEPWAPDDPDDPDTTSITIPEIISIETYPNPFKESVSIAIETEKSGDISLDIYDITGKMVMPILDNQVAEGNHLFTWNGYDSNGDKMPSGIYFARAMAGESISVKKIVLLR